MRLSEWRASSPSRDAASARVTAVVDPVLLLLGGEPNPHCWVAWGEDPAVRYTILVPTPAGLISCFVRVNQPGEGARATAKLIRWSRLQIGELAVETTGGHRLVTFQVENIVLKGADAQADRVGGFALEMFAANDGRPMPAPRAAARGRGARAAGTTKGRGVAAKTPGATPGGVKAAKPLAAKPLAAKAPGAKASSAKGSGAKGSGASARTPVTSMTVRSKESTS